MRKSKDITKYEIEWQILRSSLKGCGVSFIEDTLNKGLEYFYSQPNKARHERVFNWIEGIRMGHKAHGNLGAMSICTANLEVLTEISTNEKEIFNIEQQICKAKTYSFEERLLLWKDLFKYEKHFTSRKFRHKELESLVDLLNDIFVSKKETIPDNYSYQKILTIRSHYLEGNSNKKFFF